MKTYIILSAKIEYSFGGRNILWDKKPPTQSFVSITKQMVYGILLVFSNIAIKLA
ncbi:MAG: hypothetical protein WCZ89_00410 [Phycisphaerae bacterium]